VLHPSERFFVALPLGSYDGKSYNELQRLIERSRQAPYKYLSLALGVAVTGLLTAMAVASRALGRGVPDEIDHALAGYYYNVPEMAVHKKIELVAFARSAPQGHTLDVGCGSGIVAALLQRMTSITSLHGFDQLPAFDAQVKALGYSGFTAGDASAIPLPDASFDSVISICVLEHVEKLDEALREIRRVLKPGGRLHFTTPSPEFRTSTLAYRMRRMFGLRSLAEASARRRDKMSIHYHYRSAEYWRQSLQAIGFEQVIVEPIFSRTQLFVYDAMNFSVAVPIMYFADKLSIFGSQHPLFKRIAIWTTAVLASSIAAMKMRHGRETHFMITAKRLPAEL
jgi:ubiquinone/menaquinone biosynthesis C-methylase UbiE